MTGVICGGTGEKDLGKKLLNNGSLLLIDLIGKTDLKKLLKIISQAEFYLGMAHRRLGNEEAAKAQFEKAIALDSSFMPAHLAKQD